MNEPFEYCPVRSALSRVWRSPYTWVLASFVLGVLLMAAIGKDNDIQKAMWFATGAAITAVATAYQTYQSNKRATDERKFTEQQLISRIRHEEEKQIRESTATIRLSAYETFLACSLRMLSSRKYTEMSTELGISLARVQLLCSRKIQKKCVNLLHQSLDIIESTNKEQSTAEMETKFGATIHEIILLMNEDLGRCNVAISPTAQQQTRPPSSASSNSIPSQSTESPGTSLHTTEAPAKDA